MLSLNIFATLHILAMSVLGYLAWCAFVSAHEHEYDVVVKFVGFFAFTALAVGAVTAVWR